jgi:hypothetical protein
MRLQSEKVVCQENLYRLSIAKTVKPSRGRSSRSDLFIKPAAALPRDFKSRFSWRSRGCRRPQSPDPARCFRLRVWPSKSSTARKFPVWRWVMVALVWRANFARAEGHWHLTSVSSSGGRLHWGTPEDGLQPDASHFRVQQMVGLQENPEREDCSTTWSATCGIGQDIDVQSATKLPF